MMKKMRTRTAAKKGKTKITGDTVMSGSYMFYSMVVRTIEVSGISSDLWGFGLTANDDLRVPIDVVAHGRKCYS